MPTRKNISDFRSAKLQAKYIYYRNVETMAFLQLKHMRDHGVPVTDDNFRIIYQAWWYHRKKANVMRKKGLIDNG